MGGEATDVMGGAEEKRTTGQRGRQEGRIASPLILIGKPRSRLLAAGAPAAGSLLATLALAAFYVYALGFLNCRHTLYGDRQDTVLEAGVDLALVHVVGQRQAPAERSGSALPHQIAAALLLPLFLAPAGDG